MSFAWSPFRSLQGIDSDFLDNYFRFGVGSKIAKAVSPFGLWICIGFTKSFIVFSNYSLATITFFNYRLKKTLHVIWLLQKNICKQFFYFRFWTLFFNYLNSWKWNNGLIFALIIVGRIKLYWLQMQNKIFY